MSSLAIHIGAALGGAWLAVRTYQGARDTRALIRHHLRRSHRPRTLRIVGAPYGGPRSSMLAAEEMATHDA